MNTLTSLARFWLAGLRMLVPMLVLLGVAYPLTIWAVGQTAFPGNANGSLVTYHGRVIGSDLIGQQFTGPAWFHPRPSGYGKNTPPYSPLATGGSNLGPTSQKLLALVRERTAHAAAVNDVPPAAVPPDAVTGSASGIDPHISPAFARIQIDRVAEARGLDRNTVARLVERHTQGRTLGFLGEARVNVLELNLDLARLASR